MGRADPAVSGSTGRQTLILNVFGKEEVCDRFVGRCNLTLRAGRGIKHILLISLIIFSFIRNVIVVWCFCCALN